MKMPRRTALIAASAIVALAAGCATTPPPTEQLALAQAAVNSAVSAGAADYGALELSSAREKLSRANSAVDAKNYDLARQLAEEAQADADLAHSKATAGQAQKAANAVQEDNRVLREEMNQMNRQ